MKYHQFVKKFSSTHKGLTGPQLMKAAALDWKKYKVKHGIVIKSKSSKKKTRKRSRKRTTRKKARKRSRKRTTRKRSRKKSTRKRSTRKRSRKRTTRKRSRKSKKRGGGCSASY